MFFFVATPPATAMRNRLLELLLSKMLLHYGIQLGCNL